MALKYRKGDVQPPLETPFNGSTLQAAWLAQNLIVRNSQRWFS
jgi:hypothetical protein